LSLRETAAHHLISLKACADDKSLLEPCAWKS
jgi:hypothetical protein